jgi:isoaspartyl peptidase/L-asparaginase-like protein (Ntn-hydrolase superfamily)
MKMPGRVGDTPIIGSGFYCDMRYGGAAATGLGEDIMRGCLSYDTVSLMRLGASPQEACDEALHRLRSRMRELNETDGGMSLIAMDPSGHFGAATTVDLFPFAYGREGEGTNLYVAGQGEKATDIRRVRDEDFGGITSD